MLIKESLFEKIIPSEPTTINDFDNFDLQYKQMQVIKIEIL